MFGRDMTLAFSNRFFNECVVLRYHDKLCMFKEFGGRGNKQSREMGKLAFHKSSVCADQVGLANRGVKNAEITTFADQALC